MKKRLAILLSALLISGLVTSAKITEIKTGVESSASTFDGEHHDITNVDTDFTIVGIKHDLGNGWEAMTNLYGEVYMIEDEDGDWKNIQNDDFFGQVGVSKTFNGKRGYTSNLDVSLVSDFKGGMKVGILDDEENPHADNMANLFAKDLGKSTFFFGFDPDTYYENNVGVEKLVAAALYNDDSDDDNEIPNLGNRTDLDSDYAEVRPVIGFKDIKLGPVTYKTQVEGIIRYFEDPATGDEFDKLPNDAGVELQHEFMYKPTSWLALDLGLTTGYGTRYDEVSFDEDGKVKSNWEVDGSNEWVYEVDLEITPSWTLLDRGKWKVGLALPVEVDYSATSDWYGREFDVDTGKFKEDVGFQKDEEKTQEIDVTFEPEIAVTYNVTDEFKVTGALSTVAFQWDRNLYFSKNDEMYNGDHYVDGEFFTEVNGELFFVYTPKS